MRDRELPERDVSQSMTAKNVRRSYRSSTCPACGGNKECNSWMCETCWSVVSTHAQHGMGDRVKKDGATEGRDRYLLVAFREMQLTRWHAPASMVDARWVNQGKGGSNEQRAM